MKRLLASTFFLIAAELFAADGGFLLTDNNQPGWGSNYFREDPKIPTGVELFVVTDGDFACDEYMVETGSRPDGKKRVLLDGRLGPEGDCQAYGKWGKSAYGTFTLDFKQPYLIDRVLLWAQANHWYACRLSHFHLAHGDLANTSADKELPLCPRRTANRKLLRWRK